MDMRELVQLTEAVERCKQIIRYRAAWAGIRFLENDIVVANEDDCVVVALRRAFLGYEEDEDGVLVLDDDFEPIPLFRNLMWLESGPHLTKIEAWQGIATIEVALPRLAIRTPWLVLKVMKDNPDVIVGRRMNGGPGSVV